MKFRFKSPRQGHFVESELGGVASYRTDFLWERVASEASRVRGLELLRALTPHPPSLGFASARAYLSHKGRGKARKPLVLGPVGFRKRIGFTGGRRFEMDLEPANDTSPVETHAEYAHVRAHPHRHDAGVLRNSARS